MEMDTVITVGWNKYNPTNREDVEADGEQSPGMGSRAPAWGWQHQAWTHQVVSCAGFSLKTFTMSLYCSRHVAITLPLLLLFLVIDSIILGLCSQIKWRGKGEFQVELWFADPLMCSGT